MLSVYLYIYIIIYDHKSYATSVYLPYKYIK